MVTVPDLAPNAVGVNVTSNVHDFPDARVAPQGVGWTTAKSPEADMPEMVSGVESLLVSRTVCPGLVEPTVRAANERLAGLSATGSFAAAAPVVCDQIG